MHTCIISGFGRIPIMKNKLLLTASLSGIACLSVIMAGSLLSKNQTFSAVRSTESEYTVTFNKDTLAPFSGLSYRGSDGYRSPKVVYAQLQNPGNYAGLRDYSYYSTPIYGGNHLYQREIRDSGVKIAFKVDLHYLNANPYYYDSARTQKIYTPGYKNINKIEVTFSDQSDIPFDTSKFDNPDKITHVGNTYTLTADVNFPTNYDEINIVDIPTTAAEHVNKTIIIDQIVVTYTC